MADIERPDPTEVHRPPQNIIVRRRRFMSPVPMLGLSLLLFIGLGLLIWALERERQVTEVQGRQETPPVVVVPSVERTQVVTVPGTERTVPLPAETRFVPGPIVTETVPGPVVTRTVPAAAPVRPRPGLVRVEGVVESIAPDRKSVTFSHGAIPELERAATTSTFGATDSTVLDTVDVGDAGVFVIQWDTDTGRWEVTSVELRAAP